MNPNWIGHICSPEAWEAAQAAGEYRPPSLDSEGFIHCSRPGQLPWVVTRYYPESTDLLLLWIDPEALEAELRWEGVEGGERFPHIYGRLNLGAVVAVESLPEFLSGTS